MTAPRIYALFFIELSSRRVHLAVSGVTKNADQRPRLPCVAQSLADGIEA